MRPSSDQVVTRVRRFPREDATTSMATGFVRVHARRGGSLSRTKVGIQRKE